MAGASGGVTIVDPSDIEYSSISEIRNGDVVTLTNVRLHILGAGDRFDIHSRRPIIERVLESEEEA